MRILNFCMILCTFIIEIDISLSCPLGCRCDAITVICDGLKLTEKKLQDDVILLIPNKTRVLHLSDNEIENLSMRMLKHLKELTSLYIGNNKLTRIPDNRDNYLPQLVQLSLQMNAIDAIEADAFKGYNGLQTLDLKYNKIKTLNDNSFKELVNAKAIYLDSNHIDSITPDCWKELKQLKTLSLSGNSVKVLSNRMFTNNYVLSYVLLYDNKLTKIPFGLFQNKTGLSMIDFSHNFIDTLEEKAFHMESYYKVDVFLSNNFLESIDDKVFDNPAGITIDISNNILKCSCELIRKRNVLLQEHRNIMLRPVSCTSPTHSGKLELTSLRDKDLNCPVCDTIVCHNNGSCINGACLCPYGFHGEFCQEETCLNHICLNGAKCIAQYDTYRCQCMEGYTGVLCGKNNVTKHITVTPSGVSTKTDNPDDGMEYPYEDEDFPPQDSSHSTFIIVMSSIGVVGFILLIALALCYKRRAKKKQNYLIAGRKDELEVAS